MSIAHQSAMPIAVPRARGTAHPLRLAPAARPTRAFAKICVLVVCTALGAALAAGAVAVGLIMVAATVGG